jgi:hypothetical protein
VALESQPAPDIAVEVAPAEARARWLSLAAAAISCSAAAIIGACIVWLAGRPVSTPDLWFHLKAGETYLREGLWPKQDPMLFTGLASGPNQHEWLFGVFAHLVQQFGGFDALRAVHALLVLGTLGLVAHLFRRETGAWSAAALGGAAFGLLAYQRLIQFRPDLWSIPATLLVFGYLIVPRRLGTRSILAGSLLFCIWANAHSLAVIGLALLATAALGAALELGITGSAVDADPTQREAARVRLRGLVIAFAALSLSGLLNPRGYHQLATFLESSSHTAVLEIADEWRPFNPLAFGPQFNSGTLPLLNWLVADAVFMAYAATAVWRLRALQRERSAEALLRFDPVGFLVAAAGCGAMLISVRFLWLGILPLFYCARATRAVWTRRSGQLICALLTAALLAAFPKSGGFAREAADVPRDFESYLDTPINRARVADEGVQFLRAIAARGRIFNPYLLGAYLGFNLAPRLRTFIDSRTEHYDQSVFDQWKAVTFQHTLPDGRDYLRILDDWQVDFFFGLGVPGYSYEVPYTLAHLEHKPGWLLVFRNAGQAIYLRSAPRNRDNAERIARYYQKLGIPFDPSLGLDVAAVINTRLDWAIEQRLIPRLLPVLELQTHAGPLPARAAAAIEMADALFVAGAFRSAAQYAERALPNANDPARALTIALNALARTGNIDAAQALLASVQRERAGQAWLRAFENRPR